MSGSRPIERISVEQALLHLSQRRRDSDIVITNQSSARLWPRLSNHQLDFNYNPSTMGGAVPLGIGLALAQPGRQVIVLTGDGSLLMNLGSLVTAAASGAANLSILLLDNGMYEVTGGQKTAASEVTVDYVGLARASGFRQAVRFANLQDWRSGSNEFFAAGGPRFAWLEVGPTPTEVYADPVPPIGDRFCDFQAAVAAQQPASGGA